MPQLTKSQVKEAFEIIDVDGNGGLDKNEISRVLAQLGIRCSDAEVNGILEICDTDGSGYIEYDEFEKAMLS